MLQLHLPPTPVCIVQTGTPQTCMIFYSLLFQAECYFLRTFHVHSTVCFHIACLFSRLWLWAANLKNGAVEKDMLWKWTDTGDVTVHDTLLHSQLWLLSFVAGLLLSGPENTAVWGGWWCRAWRQWDRLHPLHRQHPVRSLSAGQDCGLRCSLPAGESPGQVCWLFLSLDGRGGGSWFFAWVDSSVVSWLDCGLLQHSD